MEQSRDVLTLPCQDHGPSTEISSPSLLYGQKGPEGVEETLKLQDLPGWRPATPCSLLWERAAPKAHASIRARTVALHNLPTELKVSLGEKALTFSVVVSSRQKGRYSASFQGQSLSAEKLSVRPSQVIPAFFLSQTFSYTY